ncbi:MAG: hypothetical protein P9L99_16570 [Candidatus Lernaella stagnicola]|nr:hypothetical protein [Candidatus Lernaella stagnicola]
MSIANTEFSLDNQVRSVQRHFQSNFTPSVTPCVVAYNVEAVLGGGDAAGVEVFDHVVYGGAGSGGYLEFRIYCITKSEDDATQVDLRRLVDAVMSVFRLNSGAIEMFDFSGVVQPEDEPSSLGTHLLVKSQYRVRGGAWAILEVTREAGLQGQVVTFRMKLVEDYVNERRVEDVETYTITA